MFESKGDKPYMNSGYIPVDIIKDKNLIPIWEKVKASVPVSEDDLRLMLSTDDVMGLGAIASYVHM